MRTSAEFSADVARRAQSVRETLDEVGHSPDSLRVARDNPTHGNLVEAKFGVEDAAGGVDKATSLLEDLGDEDLPMSFYMDEEGSEVGPADLGVVWKAIEEPDEEPTEEDMGVVWKDLTPSDFPEAWREVEEAEDMGFATLVELMVSHLSEHQLVRVAAALNEECLRRDSWTSWAERWSLPLPGGWKVALLSREGTEDEDNRADNVARTSPEDPRGDA